jgi:hypothetical protein
MHRRSRTSWAQRIRNDAGGNRFTRGADVDRESIEAAMKKSGCGLYRYDLLPDRIIVYLWPSAAGSTFQFKFKARYGLEAKNAASVLYDYYNPEAQILIAPTRFEIK